MATQGYVTRSENRKTSRRLFTKHFMHSHSLFDLNQTAEVLFDFTPPRSLFPATGEDVSFLELARGQNVRVNVGRTLTLQNKDLLFGHAFQLDPADRDLEVSEELGCFPSNCVLPHAVSRVLPCELKIDKFLGDGGFGCVYRQKYKDEMVAVKEIKATQRVSLDLLKEVNQEATILAKLSCLGSGDAPHTNLCRLLGVMVDIPDLQYSLVLEYCAGGELYHLLHQRKVTLDSYSLVLNFCQQIAAGLEYMHSALDIPIIHRDLKTKNVLLRMEVDPSDPQTLLTNTLKLIDFGLARELAKNHLTTDKGTYVYMAPEAIKSNYHSVYSDIWSLGVVFWELMVQVFPYPKLPEMVVLLGVGQGKVALPLPDTFPPDFKKLLQRCLVVDIDKRYDISRVVRDLKSLQRHNNKAPLGSEHFQELRCHWQELAGEIEVSQSQLVSVGLGSDTRITRMSFRAVSSSSTSSHTSRDISKRQSEILDLKSSYPMGVSERNLGEEIAQAQTEILNLRNNVQFSQVAQVALAVTKFKKSLLTSGKGKELTNGILESKPPCEQEIVTSELDLPFQSIKKRDSYIPREELDYLEQEFKLRQLQLELEKTKRQVIEGQKKVEQLSRKRFRFPFFNKGKQSSFDVVETEVDSDIQQATLQAKIAPRSRSNNFMMSLKSKFKRSRPPIYVTPATDMVPIPEISEVQFTPTTPPPETTEPNNKSESLFQDNNSNQ